jgi:enediyne biosynthesis protein E5
MLSKTLFRDARYFQIIFQLIFLSYGLLFLHWQADWITYLLYVVSALAFQCLFEWLKHQGVTNTKQLIQSCLSAVISALSLCLLLKVNTWPTAILASFLSISSKYLFRNDKNHFFNPSAFGIVSTILLTGDAWLSPGQWGSSVVLFFGICCLGFIVVTRVQKLDISLSFLFTYSALLFFRQVLYLNWDLEFFAQSVSTGGLLLFSFFMISDPKTAPQHRFARIIWAVMIASVSFYLSAFKFVNNAAIWVLVPAGLMVPILNIFFRGKDFAWENYQRLQFNPLSARLQKNSTNQMIKK